MCHHRHRHPHHPKPIHIARARSLAPSVCIPNVQSVRHFDGPAYTVYSANICEQTRQPTARPTVAFAEHKLANLMAHTRALEKMHSLTHSESIVGAVAVSSSASFAETPFYWKWGGISHTVVSTPIIFVHHFAHHCRRTFGIIVCDMVTATQLLLHFVNSKTTVARYSAGSPGHEKSDNKTDWFAT